MNELEKEIERLQNLLKKKIEILIKWEICSICGLDYGGYTDEPCKCMEE